MTQQELEELFEKHEDEYLRFDKVLHKTTMREDLHAFLLLDRLVPGICDIVSGAEHDEFFLDVTPDDLAKVVTEGQVVELIRCGVRYSSEHDCLSMFA